VLAQRARRVSDPEEAKRLFQAAEAKFEAALRIKPNYHDALNNWGNALAHQARQANEPEEVDRLFQAAEAKFEAGLRINPDKQEDLYNFGGALIEHGKRAPKPEQAASLFKRAETVLKDALKLAPAKTYNLACLMAVLGRLAECREFLEAAEKAGTLPSLAHLLEDDDLKAVRDQKWFGDLIEHLRAKPR
jgi:tetratricopeptide (TPR) repeat protein